MSKKSTNYYHPWCVKILKSNELLKTSYEYYSKYKYKKACDLGKKSKNDFNDGKIS